MPCHKCGKNFRGEGPTATIDGEENTYCADCYWTLKKQYEKKKSCESCSFFGNGVCRRTLARLIPARFGVEDFYVQAEQCNHFTIKKVEPKTSKIKKSESDGRHEEAALHVDVNSLVKNLAERGQTLTYYCCHCGAPLKIGAKSVKVQKTCPHCGCDLEVINLGKFINQHSS